MTYFYFVGKDGRVHRRLLTGKKRLRGEDRPDYHFSQTVLKGYYARECQEGSRFQSGYTKNLIKKVHETALARYAETGQES